MRAEKVMVYAVMAAAVAAAVFMAAAAALETAVHLMILDQAAAAAAVQAMPIQDMRAMMHIVLLKEMVLLALQ
jgi:hypothetical protein